MEKLTLSEIAGALGGSFNSDCEINSVCIDTRKITEGCLFICIKGERFDGHDFAEEAIEKGAAAVMVHKVPQGFDGKYVLVENTSKGLLDLGAYYRSKFTIPVVGLTGSVGKTTTKEFTYLVVSAKYNAIKTLGNLNNEIGLPQMLFHIDSKTEAAVIEMGMNHFGEIHRLTTAAKPTLALITNIGVSHIENLGSREGILKAKLEILDGLEKGSPLIVNGDNDMLKTVCRDDYRILRFGIENKDCDFLADNISQGADGAEFDIKYFGKIQHIAIPAIGTHIVYNALAAFAVGYCLDIPPQDCADALADYVPEGMRQKVVHFEGMTFIEDCYNASPDSMKAAISTLSGFKGRKIAVLSDMLELGDISADAHENVGRLAGEKGVDALYCYGELSKHTAEGAEASGVKEVHHFENKDLLSDALLKELRAGDTVVFKASRGMKLEDVIKNIYDRWEVK